jgi:hypothetical protein
MAGPILERVCKPVEHAFFSILMDVPRPLPTNRFEAGSFVFLIAFHSKNLRLAVEEERGADGSSTPDRVDLG